MAVQQRNNNSGRKSDKNAPSVPQVDALLDRPLDIDAPPTIYSVNLKPEYGTAALNLSADFIKQEQAQANKYLFFHPIILIVLAFGLLIYLTPRVYFPLRNTGSVAGWFYQLALINRREVLTGLVFTAIGASFLFTLLSRVSDSYFKSKINQLVASKGEKVFGINLNDLVARHETEDPVVNNTHIIVYRETPIALISLSPNMTLSTNENLVMSVTTVGCRRVYVKSGIIEDLIDWAMPVSYTHLDVYKRQLFLFFFFLLLLFLLVLFFLLFFITFPFYFFVFFWLLCLFILCILISLSLIHI